MIFPFPNYLDHPNLHQFQQNQEHYQQSIGGENHQLQPLQAPPPPLGAGGVGAAGLIRSGSMVDRARIAELPLPEAQARCPRCDSTNTKFCYYNNYNLSQPRHFCKGCRRYWTKGGSLRNVPVGGSCRRNKRSKSNGSSSSKSTAGDEKQSGIIKNSNSSSTSGAAGGPSIRGITTNMAGHHFQQSSPFQLSSTQLPYMPTLHNFNQYTVAEPGFHHQVHGLANIGFNIGSNSLDGGSAGPSAEPPIWLLSSIHGGFDPTTSFFQLQKEGVNEGHHQLPSSMAVTTRSPNENTSLVKMENHQNRTQEFNVARQSLDVSENPQQHWVANPFTDEFSGLDSSSSSHLL